MHICSGSERRKGELSKQAITDEVAGADENNV